MTRQTIESELPGRIGNINIESTGWWMDVHTVVGTLRVPFNPPPNMKGVVFGGDHEPKVVVTVAVTMDFLEAGDG